MLIGHSVPGTGIFKAHPVEFCMVDNRYSVTDSKENSLHDVSEFITVPRLHRERLGTAVVDSNID